MRLPVPVGTKIVWAAASLMFIFVFTVRDRNAAWTFVPTNAPAWKALVEAGVLSAFGALCLWQQLRRVFLTAYSQVPTFFGLWILFATAYPVIGGLIMLAGPEVRWVGPFAADVEWQLTAQSIAAGQLAFLGAMLASLVWNVDEPGFSSVRLNRDVALLILGEAEKQKALSTFRAAQLDVALRALQEDAPKLSAKLLNTSDAALLERWWQAAATLRGTVSSRPTITLATFDWETVASPMRDLRSRR